MIKFRPLAVALTLASVVAAGAIAEFRDGPVADDVKNGEIGEAIALTKGQRLTVSEVNVGAFHRGGYDSSRGMSVGGRFVQIRFVASTDHARGITSLNCSLQTRRGGEVFPIGLPRVSFPQSGFSLSQALLWEVSEDDLGGAAVSCVEASVLSYREVEVRADLGFDDAQALLRSSATKELRPIEESLEVTR